MIPELYLLLTLVFISCLFSSGESALFSLDDMQKNQMSGSARHKKSNKRILEWLKQPEKTLSAILLGNLATNILISELGHVLIDAHTNFSRIHTGIISLIAITLLILIFAEIIPKVLALQIPVRWSIFVSPFLRVWFFISHYISQPIHRLMKYATSKLPAHEKNYTEKELLDSISLSSSYNLIHENEAGILKKSVIFHHDTVFQTMIPRSRVFMVPHTISALKIRESFLEKNYDFSIVYHTSTKKLLGYLHIRNLALLLHKKLKSINSRVQDILFLPQTMPLDQALKNMIQEKIEVAAIVDESGEFSGVLTLKTLLKKLMGDWEEGTKQEPSLDELIKKVDEHVFKVNGSVTLNQFNDFFGIHLEHQEIETVSGYIIQRLDGFPKNATSFQIGGLEIYDIKLKGNRLESFLVRRHNVRRN